MYRHFLHYPQPDPIKPEDTILNRAYHKVVLLRVLQYVPEAQLIEELSKNTSICIQTVEEVCIDENVLKPPFTTMKWNVKMPEWLKGESS